MVNFEWDENKNQSNRKKHGIWFEEATQVFDDPNAIMYHDKDNSSEGDRFIMLGISASMRVLVVIYCERSKDIIRIISARKATKEEAKDYEEGI
ncbi:MAG: hypothetical protein A4S09_07135 [Proteobacteria bacterium SG_bin7]|nr:MAG: hypothetical protein A4S09_07135 [Proteobacteria bacterium SG_bin7]